MHELGLTMEMIDIAIERADGRPVHALKIAIGELAAIDPSAIQFCFDACQGERDATPLAHTRLDIERVPGKARCPSCTATWAIHRPYGKCACGNTAIEITEGVDLTILGMEVG